MADDWTEDERRGWAINSKNMRKTSCPQGHPYSPENTARPPKGGRICLTCHPTYWRHAEAPRARPPGSRVKVGDPDYPGAKQQSNQGGV